MTSERDYAAGILRRTTGEPGVIADDVLAQIDAVVTDSLDECYTLIAGLRELRRSAAGVAITQRAHGRGTEVARILGQPRQRLPRRGRYTLNDVRLAKEKVDSAVAQLNRLINTVVIQKDYRSATTHDVR